MASVRAPQQGRTHLTLGFGTSPGSLWLQDVLTSDAKVRGDCQMTLEKMGISEMSLHASAQCYLGEQFG